VSPPPAPPPVVKKETKETKDEEPALPSDDGPIINEETFGQILELDDEDDHSFSWGMVAAFFNQAEATFKEMDTAYASKDLDALSKKGHFLKGSSAALGVQKVQDSCENIQNYGKLRDEEAGVALTSEVALKKIGALLGVVKRDFKDAKEHLRKRYTDLGVDVDAPVELE
jgi:HPt (histidine-containing phosphotransfer) domain-containing protein